MVASKSRCCIFLRPELGHQSSLFLLMYWYLMVQWHQQAHCWLLTLNMLNCFKDYKRYIHILNRILELARPKLTKLTLGQQYMSVLHSHYHACWCSGNFGSQGISKHGIESQNWNIPSPASEELTDMWCLLPGFYRWKWLSTNKISVDRIIHNGLQKLEKSHWGLVTPFGDIDLGQHWLK